MYKDNQKNLPSLAWILTRRPEAWAQLKGSAAYPDLAGTVRFHALPGGVLVVAAVSGLPRSADDCESPVFGFHLHEGVSCTGNADDPFANAGSHYDPHHCPHPYHAGDFPPLFGAHGMAFCAFLTDRFAVSDVIGKTVIIHGAPDDFTTQPAGNAGQKIACGVIEP